MPRTIETLVDCAYCKGEACIPCPSSRCPGRDCPDCGGNGSVDCPECKGEGTVEVEDPIDAREEALGER